MGAVHHWPWYEEPIADGRELITHHERFRDSQGARRHRRCRGPVRLTATGGAVLQGMLPLPQREDAVVLRLPRPPELALLRGVQHRRRRDHLRREEGEPVAGG